MAEVGYSQRFKFPGWYPEGAREVFFERLAIAEDLGLDIADGSEALAQAAREGKAELLRAIQASGLSPEERRRREQAALPLDFPRGLADNVLHVLADFKLTCKSVEPRTPKNFPPKPQKPSPIVTQEIAA